MGVVDEPIQDGIRDGRIANQFVPMLDGELADDDGGGASMAVVESLQEIASLLGGEWGQTPIVQDQELDARERPQEPAEAAITAREQWCIEQPWQAPGPRSRRWRRLRPHRA